ncbi:MAG: recombinase family protein [Clostridia bacterium]
MKQRVYCLYRVSTAKQVDHDKDNNADIPMQRKACREFADKMGWDIVKEEQENGVSGFKVSANDRDKIQSIKLAAEQGKFDILLVFMFDRLGRKADETPFVVEWFSKHNIKIWSVQEGEQKFESHTDHLMNYIRFWQADGESQKTSMRTKTALSQMVQEGRFRGGTAPYGYKLVPSGIYNKRKHEVFKLVIDEEEASVVRTMFGLVVNSGYGRFKIANFLSDNDMLTRKGDRWHDSSVGGILHNVMYMGVLRSGETKSEIFEELQIVDQNTFELAQRLMLERTNDYKGLRTMPRNINGQSLLSGNVFCGHCGGRLTLTTSGDTRVNANGEETYKKRIRYNYYNKTRKRCDCDGQTGYTMHILDGIVTKVLHQIFDKMKDLNADEVLARTQKEAIKDIKARITKAKTQLATATKEYDNLKAEVVKSIQGDSKFPVDILSELVNSAKVKSETASSTLAKLNKELEERDAKINVIKTEYNKLIKWSKIFDESEREVQKMIAAYIIKRLYVHKGYHLEIEFTINFSQFDLGLEEDGYIILRAA